MAERIYFRGSRREARRIVSAMVTALTGGSSDNSDLAAGVHTAIGFAALSDITDDFVRKSRGGVGEDGVKWAPLQPATLAYGRKAPKGKGHAPGGKDGLLTMAQLKRWRQVYGHSLARMAMSMDLGAAKVRAAQAAWSVVKSEGGQTKIAAYADRPHEILRDTGVLLNSLSPGQIGGDGASVTYSPPSGPGGSEQIFRSLSSGVIVGTNVPYAATHQNGNAKRNIPARPFLPKGDAPQTWRDRWAAVGMRGVSVAIRIAIMRGGSRA